MLSLPLGVRTRIRNLEREMRKFAAKESIPLGPPYGVTLPGVPKRMERYHERLRRLRVLPHPNDLELPAGRLCHRDVFPSPSDPNHLKLAKDRIIAKLNRMGARVFVVDPYAMTDTENRLRVFLDKYEVTQTFGEVHFEDLVRISEFKSIVAEEEGAARAREQERDYQAKEREKKRVERVRSSEEFENLGWAEFTTDFILNHSGKIKAEAAKQNVDPVAIAGVVAWERQNNLRGWLSDRIWQKKQCEEGTISETAGIGYGSIHLDVAEAIERGGRVAAAVSLRERCKRLQDPRWAIQYIAAIMAQDAENYQSIAGLSIRARPDILATLYNTGNSKEKAERKRKQIDDWELRSRSGPQPEPTPNVMGRWINANLRSLQFLLAGGSVL